MRFLTVLLLLAAPLFGLAEVKPSFGDAPLRAIQFYDENEGWAAGDDGVVWHTIDGGKNWERQSTGTRASLRAIQFLTPYSGWAVGRIELPGGGSSGVVLSTSDGGLKWDVVSSGSLPGLNLVKFFGERQGIAAGDGSNAYPSGLFSTIDGGKSWKPVPGTRSPSWFAGDFGDPENGVLAGAWNRIAPVRENAMGVADVDSLGGRDVRALKLQGDRAIAVGQGGLVMVSQESAGVRWGFPEIALPKAVLQSIDFHALAVRGKQVWAVGRPGSVVLHSADEGMSWKIQQTGQPLPLHSVYFIDEKTGWACGELGTILATTDGGHSWKVQRQGGLRSAALFAMSQAKTAPMESVATLGADDGYLTTMLGVSCADPATLARKYASDAERVAAAMKAADADRATDRDRLSYSMRLSGGAAGEVLWHFPMAGFQEGAPAAMIQESWQKKHEESPMEAMLRQLVLSIRIWRPEVVVTDSGKGSDVEQFVAGVVRKAFEMASEETAFPEQLDQLGLQPWAARKLFAMLDKPDATCVKIDGSALLSRVGEAARDVAAEGGRLWDDNSVVPMRGYRLVATRMKNAEGMPKIFDGISLAPGGAARRPLPVLSEIELARAKETQKALEKRKHTELILAGATGGIGNPEQALSTLGDMIRELSPNDAGKALFSAAGLYVKTGRWTMAREAYMIMVDKYPGHPLSLEAARWLIRYQASSEARRRQELGQFIEISQTSISVKSGGTISREPAQADPMAPMGPMGNPLATPGPTSVNVGPKKKSRPDDIAPPKTEIVQASHRQYVDSVAAGRKWYQAAIELEPRLAIHGDMYIRDPAINLCLASAKRQLGQADDSQRWLAKYLSETTPPVAGSPAMKGSDPYRDCALLESWLINRTGGAVPPKPIGACRLTPTRPFLDGKLNDECWQKSPPMFLATTAGDMNGAYGCREMLEAAGRKEGLSQQGLDAALASNATKASFACDDEYLYVAVVCKYPVGMQRDKVDKRTRDMNLKAHDRVSILLDLDRDYQTYFQFQVDQRGAVAEDCWGDSSWNPKWFVAVQSDDTSWTAEIAIPLKELTGESLNPGKMWGVNVVRTIPGKGIQSWSGPAGANPRPEGMGILSFIADLQRP